MTETPSTPRADELLRESEALTLHSAQLVLESMLDRARTRQLEADRIDLVSLGRLQQLEESARDALFDVLNTLSAHFFDERAKKTIEAWFTRGTAEVAPVEKPDVDNYSGFDRGGTDNA